MFALLEEIHKRFPEQEHLSISYAWGGPYLENPGTAFPLSGRIPT
ncbi:hypothetical protein PAPH110629_20800 [Paenibacillus phoenicis]